MAGTATAAARVIANPASISEHENAAHTPEVPARVREGAAWFFWIVGLATMNSLFIIAGSHIHRFTGFGVSAIAGSGVMQVIVSGWFAAGLLFLGYCAAEGQKWAFVTGMAAYSVDGALLVGSGDYLSAVLHAVMLYLIYRGFSALGQAQGSKLSDAASA